MPPNFGDAAEGGAAATDASAQVNVTGANTVADLAAQEAAEIAAVPDPQSPAGQAQILAIIEKYQRLSAGTVDGSAAAEQANGSKAASDSGKDDDHDHDSGKDDLSSGGGLMQILSSLLGAGGGMGSGMGGGSDPFGQQQQSPLSDAYGQQQPSTQSASDPFAPIGGTTPGSAVTNASNYDPASDPFATTASTGSGTATVTDGTTGTDGSTQPTGATGNGETAGTSTDGSTGPNAAPAAAGGTGGGVDASAFAGTGGSGVPADPGAS